MHFLLAVFARVFIAYCAANSVGFFAGTFDLCIYAQGLWQMRVSRLRLFEVGVLYKNRRYPKLRRKIKTVHPAVRLRLTYPV